MTTKGGDAALQMEEFERALDEILGRGTYPLEVVGDLSDLLDTLRKTELHLNRLRKLSDKRDGPKLLLQLEILLKGDLPMIFDDLVPPLSEMSTRAFDLAGEEE